MHIVHECIHCEKPFYKTISHLELLNGFFAASKDASLKFLKDYFKSLDTKDSLSLIIALSENLDRTKLTQLDKLLIKKVRKQLKVKSKLKTKKP